MQSITRRASVGLALLGLSFFTLASYAQGGLDAVIVTATRFPEHRLDAPIGTRIITSEEIRNSTATTVPEVLQKLGGLHTRNVTGTPDMQIDLRGFGMTGDDNTLVLLDGVRFDKFDLSTRGLSGIPLHMIERIEILPGAGAVQYGAGAAGGTVNIVTKAPRAGERSFGLYGGVGSRQTRELRIDGAMANGSVGFNIAANRYMSDNYRDNNELEQNSGIGQLRWQSGDHRMALRFGAEEQDLGLPGARTEAELHSDPRGASTPRDHGRRESGFVTLSGGTRWGEVEFDVDVNYREGDMDAEYVDFNATYRTEHRALNISPRARWSTAVFGRPTQFVLGTDFYDWQWESFSASPFGATTGEVEQRSRAVYIMALSDITRSTRLNLGWRAQRVETEHGEAPTARDDKRTLYASEIGLRQALSEQISVYLKTTRSFRLANADENALTPTGDLLRPQTSRNKEIGIEYRNGGVRATASAFDMKIDDEIHYVPLPPVFANTNLPPTRRRGMELSLGWQPTRTLDFNVMYSYVDAEFRRGSFNGVDLRGNEVPLVPRRRTTINAQWEFMPRTTLGASYSYVGEQRYDDDQANLFPEKMPSYELLDVRLSHVTGRWLLGLNVVNALDETYYSYGTIGFCATFCAYPQSGRTYFASAEYRFN